MENRNLEVPAWQVGSQWDQSTGEKDKLLVIFNSDARLMFIQLHLYDIPGYKQRQAYKNSSYNFSRILFSSRQLIFFGLSINILMYFPNFRSA